MIRRTAVSLPEVAADVIVEAEGWPEEIHLQRLVDRAIHGVLGRAPRRVRGESEVAVVFTDDVSIQVVNREHRGFDKPTNVLSFPIEDRDAAVFGPLLGDIIIARETVEREAETAGLSLDDHLSHMIVHGFLHLLGYDHIEEGEAVEMEALETAILGDFGIADPYADLE